MYNASPKRARVLTGFLAAASLSSLLSPHAHADTTSWIAGSGLFTTASNWNNGIPGSDDTAVFNRGPGTTYNVTFPGGSVLDPPPSYVINYLRVHSNDVTFRDNSTPFTTAPSLTVANPDVSIVIGQDSGELAILNTSLHRLSGTRTSIGRAAGANGTLNVIAGTVSSRQLVEVGGGGRGTLNITAAGRVETELGTLGATASGIGNATISGPGSTWINLLSLQVGEFGMGTLRIEAGGSAVSQFGAVGTYAGSTGMATVTGIGSTWTTAGILRVDRGSLTIEAGGTASSMNGAVGAQFDNLNGTALVTGAGSAWTISERLYVGDSSPGSSGHLRIAEEGLVDIANDLILAKTGTVTLDGGHLATNSINSFNEPELGKLNFLAGSLTIRSGVDVGSGTLLPSNLTLTRHQKLITLATTTIATRGTIEIDGGALTTNNLVVNGALQFNRGTLELTGGTVTGLTSLIVPSNGELRARGLYPLRITGQAGSTITASGNLTLGDATKVNGFYSGGTIDVGANNMILADANDAVLDSGALATLGSGPNPGMLRAPNGLTLNFGGNITGFGTLNTPNDPFRPLINNGHISGNSPSQRITLPGLIKGVGTLNNVLITGTDSPGFSPATVYRGSVTYNGALQIELAGTTPGSFDRLIHSGTAALGGQLSISLLNGFTPLTGDCFTILTANSITGSFSNAQDLLTSSGRTYAVDYNPNNVTLIDLTRTDIASQSLVRPNGKLLAIRRALIAGRNAPTGGAANGQWNGTQGITSSTAAQAAQDNVEDLSVGYALNSDLLIPFTTFHGQPVSPTDILITLTRNADATLDGVVDDNDVSLLGGFYNPSYDPIANGPRHWYQGDFNYNGIVEDNDVSILNAFYNPSATPLSTSTLSLSPFSSVPEPASIGLTLASATILVARRRTRVA